VIFCVMKAKRCIWGAFLALAVAAIVPALNLGDGARARQRVARMNVQANILQNLTVTEPVLASVQVAVSITSEPPAVPSFIHAQRTTYQREATSRVDMSPVSSSVEFRPVAPVLHLPPGKGPRVWKQKRFPGDILPDTPVGPLRPAAPSLHLLDSRPADFRPGPVE
jgi:hypothetical protein